MKVVVRELGSRPPIATPARLNAPKGAMALADLFVPYDFADICIINIDWEGDGFKPAMIIDAAKWHREWPTQPLTIKMVVDLEDAFGLDNMDNYTLREIVESFKVSASEAYEVRKQGEARGTWSDRVKTYDIHD